MIAIEAEYRENIDKTWDAVCKQFSNVHVYRTKSLIHAKILLDVLLQEELFDDFEIIKEVVYWNFNRKV